jgi:ankyrin repeat protein
VIFRSRLGLDVNHAGNDSTTPLYAGSRAGHAEVVSVLLAKQGVKVNQAANTGATPLYIAGQNGHAEVVSVLLAKQGVDANQAKNDGCTPLLIARTATPRWCRCCWPSRAST